MSRIPTFLIYVAALCLLTAPNLRNAQGKEIMALLGFGFGLVAAPELSVFIAARTAPKSEVRKI